ncbi:MAG: 1-deoxy-D-xylulose-5-phosphate reductoisomerase [Paracoccaceae bacterium]
MTDRKQISIFGSTGSIGVNTVDILLRSGGRNKFHVKVLSGGNNVKLLAEQAIKLQAELVVTAFSNKLEELNSYLSGSGIQTSAGEGALLEAACINCDWTMSSIVGAAGIKVGLKSLEHGGVLALANKETMVCAGDLAKKLAKKYQSKIIPVDSEHSAIFQCLRGEKITEVESVTLTASGGPFRNLPIDELKNVSPSEAANHPNWSMGKKISIDSASMFNKGLEVVEAHHLFSLSGDMINVLIHPESIIHALVNFNDGASIAQMGVPDMRSAIGFALNYPDRPFLDIKRMDLRELSALTFEKVDFNRWPSLRLAYTVIDLGGSAGVVYNAVKEEALEAYINEEIGFLDMFRCVETVIEYLECKNYFTNKNMNIDEIFENDKIARDLSQKYLKGKSF